MGNSVARTAKAAARAQQQVKALQARLAGATYEQIGTLLSTSKAAAFRLVQDAIAAIPREDATQVRALELDRLDAMLRPAFKKARDGDLHAMDRVLAIQVRRSRYLGLDAAKQIDVTATWSKEMNSILDRMERQLSPDDFLRIAPALIGAFGAPDRALGEAGPPADAQDRVPPPVRDPGTGGGQ